MERLILNRHLLSQQNQAALSTLSLIVAVVLQERYVQNQQAQALNSRRLYRWQVRIQQAVVYQSSTSSQHTMAVQASEATATLRRVPFRQMMKQDLTVQ